MTMGRGKLHDPRLRKSLAVGICGLHSSAPHLCFIPEECSSHEEIFSGPIILCCQEGNQELFYPHKHSSLRG